jgi:hypothetical protein
VQTGEVQEGAFQTSRPGMPFQWNKDAPRMRYDGLKVGTPGSIPALAGELGPLTG